MIRCCSSPWYGRKTEERPRKTGRRRPGAFPRGSRNWTRTSKDRLRRQLFGVPLWSVAFVLFAFLAPSREARRMLVTAVAIELVIGACALVHWFSPAPPL